MDLQQEFRKGRPLSGVTQGGQFLQTPKFSLDAFVTNMPVSLIFENNEITSLFH
jgi:hypothetical protein